MKIFFFRSLVVCQFLMMASYIQAQINLDDVLNGVLGSSDSNNGMASNLTTVFSCSKQATEKNIVGTWSYSEPAIVFTSDNLIAKVASKVAANKLEKKIQEYLTQYGIKPGAVTLTFKEDGTFTESTSGKKMSGKWTVKDSKLQVSIAGVKALQITTQVHGKNMQFVTDATKLLNLFKTLGAKSSNSNIKAVTSLMKNVDGMQAGVTLRKQ